jgi:hypothetical protein
MIVNIMDFENYPDYVRSGSEKDVEELKTLFKKLDYCVETYINLKAQV